MSLLVEIDFAILMWTEIFAVGLFLLLLFVCSLFATSETSDN